MCGIAGVYCLNQNEKADPIALKRMSDVIAYRGPDGDGFYVNNRLGLAHRRLSIIDLSLGAQPMYSDDEQIAVVFNGEIYNYIEVKHELELMGHKFRTTSDTEVIIRSYQQWGVKCQEKFNGMWAFALWDENKKELFISRDRLGEKPLVYGVFNNKLLFGSEIKSIGAYGVSLQPANEMLELFMFLGYIPEPFTFYKGIKKLKAGHYLLIKNDVITEKLYWDLPEIDEGNLLRDEKSVVEEFSALFSDAVKIRMRSDVAFGAFLSGGLDSSSIVSLMSAVSAKPVETFTIGFQEKKFDERGMAKVVAERFGTNHHEHLVTAAAWERSLQRILYHYDEPFADPAAIPTDIVSKYAAEKVKMVLTGDGADEVLAGYTTYRSEMLAASYQQAPAFARQWLPLVVDKAAKLFKGNLRYKANQMSRVFENYNVPFGDRLISKFSKISSERTKSLYGGGQIKISDFIGDFLSQSNLQDPFYQLTRYNLKVSLPGQMLVKVDKMSMANSLETRAPFLDHRIVEYLYGVDKHIKLPNAKGVKNVLKKAMVGKVPDEIINRKKKGFDVPLREWFKDDLFEQKLNIDFDRYGLNNHLVKTLFDENREGKADHGTMIWRILLYTRWMDRF